MAFSWPSERNEVCNDLHERTFRSKLRDRRALKEVKHTVEVCPTLLELCINLQPHVSEAHGDLTQSSNPVDRRGQGGELQRRQSRGNIQMALCQSCGGQPGAESFHLRPRRRWRTRVQVLKLLVIQALRSYSAWFQSSGWLLGARFVAVSTKTIVLLAFECCAWPGRFLGRAHFFLKCRSEMLRDSYLHRSQSTITNNACQSFLRR